MKLIKLSDRIFYYPYESDNDRPNLGYIRGDNFAVAIDAGHSAKHVEEFYKELEKEGYPLPTVTILTHWHWDHSFGMHAVNGICIANSRTNQHLLDFKDRLEKEGKEFFLNIHETIRVEYKEDTPVIVVPADIVFDKELLIDAGNCPIRLLTCDSPHTDDSTLVQIVNERIVFLGDAGCGVFPIGTKDRELCEKYAATIASLDVDKCLEGHWTIDTPEGIIEDVLNG